MQLLTANRTKKGYYIRRVKESLWSVFGIKRIKPFEDNYTKDQMKEWKHRESVRKVHDDLYSPVNPEDQSSETYVTLIIKSVFSDEKELTNENAVWTLSVLESIFDVEHLSTKIDNEVIESWKGALEHVIS
jgi:hypothetical protein